MSDVRQQIVDLIPRLRRFACTLTGSRDAADDIVQTALERALTRLDQWQPDTHLDRWLMRIVHNVWIDEIRRNRRFVSVPEVSDRHLGADPGDRLAEARVALSQTRVAIARLPALQRDVLALVCVDGRSYKEAAEILDVPVGTVMSRLARARKQLADMLESPNHRNAGMTVGKLR
ncbi:sigma-70 family RNA polymerase sigma factor [Rhodovibrio sodomensis]|uniref:sigma-70 family RNA polymerase sigma factor n=1 Tax=Rhodovibrio sodomensis TaxID=1088 RepID=UPI0019039D65